MSTTTDGTMRGPSPSGVDAVLLDYGGVLAPVESPDDGFRSMAAVIHDRLRHTDLRVEDVEIDLCDGWHAYAGWKTAQSRNPHPHEVTQPRFWEWVTCDWPAAEQAAVRAHATVLTRELELRVIQRPARADAAQLLRTLSAAGVGTGIVSNCLSGDAAREQLEADGLLSLLDVTVFSNEVGVRKPGPDILQIGLAALGTDPAHGCFVGDRLDRDILAGRRAGVGTTVLFLAETGSGRALRGVEPDHTIASLSELPNVLGVTESPGGSPSRPGNPTTTTRSTP